ncbi:MAG: DUF3048 domain-containing protein [Armatimonadetes bacterium]|nr:DUF3048 domain-containing protein [Anaerolineae bacterium]
MMFKRAFASIFSLIVLIVVAATLTAQVVRPIIYATATPAATAAPTSIYVVPPNPALGLIDPSDFAPTVDFPQAIAGALGPVDFPLDVNPLTGLTLNDPTVLNRRPLVVKISNAPPLVRPQAGIGQADIVYEHYTEGGLTRFSAIYYSQAPRRVGSIRSARLIDYELTEMYKGNLAFSGASGGVEARLNGSEFAARLFKGVALGAPYYWRDENIEVPHNLFTDVEALWTLAGQQNLNQRPFLRGMAFLPSALLLTLPYQADGAATRADIRYRATRILWTYDAATAKYQRSADGKPHFDADGIAPLSADNIVIVYAGHYLTDIVESEWQGGVSYSSQITLWPQGDAVLLRDGQRYDGTWVRATRPDLLGFRTKDGGLLYLKPGVTWVQVVQLPEQMNPAEEWVTLE